MASALNTAIVDALRVAELRRLAQFLDQIIEKNIEKSGRPEMGFLHQGLTYRHSGAPLGKILYRELHPGLHDEMNNYLTSKGNVDGDLQQISQGLLPIVRLSASQQDLRDGLPECLIQVLKLEQLAGIARTREPAFMLEPGSAADRMFKKILPKIEFLTAARLLY